jgi:hypothetical protein
MNHANDRRATKIAPAPPTIAATPIETRRS